MKISLGTLVIAVGLMAPPLPAAADAATDIIACTRITEDIARLACYDRAVAKTRVKIQEHTQRLVAQFSGQGAGSTRPFSVNGPWEAQWNASGMVFQIYLHTSSGNLVNVIANQGAGGGTSYQPKGGRYFLKINAMGSWTVRVVSVP